LSEAPSHPHNQARGTFAELDGLVQPAVAPRFSRTPGTLRSAPPKLGADGRAVLGEIGYAPEEIDKILQPV